MIKLEVFWCEIWSRNTLTYNLFFLKSKREKLKGVIVCLNFDKLFEFQNKRIFFFASLLHGLTY